MAFRRLSSLDFLVILFALSAIPALFIGYDQFQGIPTLLALAGGCLIYFWVSRQAAKPHWWRWIAGGLVGLGCLVSVYFVTQAGHLEYADKVEAIFRLSRRIARFFPAIPLWRPHTNSMAIFLEGIFLLCVPLMMSKAGKTQKWAWRGAFFVIGLAILLSASRGAWLALLFVFTVWLAYRWVPMRWLLLFLGVAAVCLGGWAINRGSVNSIYEIPLLSAVLKPIFNRPDRLEVIWNSYLLAKDYPLTGIGSGDQFDLVYSRYQLYMPYVFLTHAHNLFLQIWLELGLGGLVIWVALATIIVTGLWTNPVSTRRIRTEAVWAGLATMLAHGIVDSRMTQDLWCWLPFFVLLGLLSARASSRPRNPVLDGWRGFFMQGLRWAPLVSSLVAVIIALSPNPITAVLTNLGALSQTRADLSKDISGAQKSANLQRAKKNFQRALVYQPEQRGANYRLGLIALEEYQFEQAIHYFERARPADSGHTGLKKALGLAYTFSGEVEEGRPWLVGQVDIVNELDYWGHFFSALQMAEAAQSAYLQARLIRSGQ